MDGNSDPIRIMPPASRAPILERAYELARSGECASVGDVRRRLKAEGYSGIQRSIQGPVLLKHLASLCTASSATV